MSFNGRGNNKLARSPIPSVVLAIVVLVVACVASPVRPAAADTRLVVREEAWSLGKSRTALVTLVRTEVSGRMRRLENQVIAGAADSLKRAAHHVQIDRVDRDTSYYLRDEQKAYLGVAYSTTRDQNLRRAAAFRRAQAAGTAPRDTLPAVTTRELGRTRTIAGVACRGFVVALRFDWRDSTTAPGDVLWGVLADTLWMAPESSPAGPLAEFDHAFARATCADSFFAAPNAVQLAQAPGQGLVSVLTRALRRLPGYALASSFENVLYGVPKGLTGVERRADGSVLVQRTRRQALELTTLTLPPARFDVPRDYRRLGGP